MRISFIITLTACLAISTESVLIRKDEEAQPSPYLTLPQVAAETESQVNAEIPLPLII